MKTQKPQTHSRYIPTRVRRQVWMRDQGRCTYVSPDGRSCNHQSGLQIDHRIPFSQGGRSDEITQLRLLCPAHNQWEAIQKLGIKTMEPYLKQSR